MGMCIIERRFVAVLKPCLLLSLINIIQPRYWIWCSRIFNLFFLFDINLSTVMLSQFILVHCIFLLKLRFIFDILFHHFDCDFTADEVVNPICHPLFESNVLVGFVLPPVTNPLIHELLHPTNDEAHCLFDCLGHLDIEHLVYILKVIFHWYLLCLVLTVFPVKWKIWG